MPKPSTSVDEKLFQLLISSVAEYAIFMTDPNGYIKTWNHGAEKIKGYTADDVIGKHISIFYTAEDKRANKPNKNLSEALRNNSYETEGWRIKKDGTTFWAHIVFSSIYDENGFLLGFAKVTRDMTAVKKADDQRILVNAELEHRVSKKSQKLISSERRFRKLIENSYDGISLFDSHMQLVYRSRSAKKITGWDNEERFVHPTDTLIHPDDILLIKETFDRVLEQPDEPVMATYRARHKKGYYFWVECIFTNKLLDEDINAIVCNFKDVTERIVATELIGEKNRQITNILESITDGFIALDKNYCYTYVNSKITEITGHAAEDLIGKCVWDIYPDAVGSDTYHAFKQAMDEQTYVTNEDYYGPLDLWQENHIYPSQDGLSIFIRDISKRKQTERSLVESESNLRTVFEHADQAIILFDVTGKLRSFNNKAKALGDFFFTTELEVGKSMFDYCLPERVEQIQGILRQLKVQPSINYEVSYPVTDHQPAWFEARWVSVTDTEGTQVGIILTMKNITAKKLADIERDRITADLIQRNKDLEQFTYIVSHNLRAPVANIKGLSDLLSLSESWDEDTRDELSALATSVANLDHVIMDLNQILEASNASNDTLEVVSLPNLVDEVMEVNAQLIRKNNATVSCNFKQVGELHSLKSYMYSIFQNLVVNSIKYHRPEVPPIIEITSERGNTTACICFKDNGKGIDLTVNGGKIFGLYRRFDLSVEGKGMGLFMVKMQVERLGGKITVKSQPGEGTEFKLEFPL